MYAFYAIYCKCTYLLQLYLYYIYIYIQVELFDHEKKNHKFYDIKYTIYIGMTWAI